MRDVNNDRLLGAEFKGQKSKLITKRQSAISIISTVRKKKQCRGMVSAGDGNVVKVKKTTIKKRDEESRAAQRHTIFSGVKGNNNNFE